MEENTFIKKLTKSVESFAKHTIVFALLIILVRFFEFFILKSKLSLPKNAFSLELSGMFTDILFLLVLSSYLIIPFVIIHLIIKKLANVLYSIIIVVYIISDIALISYFSKTSAILGADLFGYSFSELKAIIATSGGFSFVSLFPLIIGILVIIGFILASNFLKLNRIVVYVFIAACFISSFFQKFAFADSKNFKTEIDYNLTANKANYLFDAGYRHFIHPVEPTEESLSSFFYTNFILVFIHFV